ncbi:MAG: methyltransferase [Actinomadura sp.]
MGNVPGGQLPAAVAMREALYGQLLSRALCTVAKLGIPGLLGDGPRSAESLADSVRANPASLRRVLRALTAFDVFTEHEGGTFGLTPFGATLRADAPMSALPTALLAGAEVGAAWNELEDVVRTGKPAFPELFGQDFFDYLQANPELRGVLDRSQAEGMALEIDELIACLDVTGRRTVVDVGGGDGALLAHLLSADPQLRGALVDLPSVVAVARDRLARRGLADRCDFVAGDFFEDVIPGGGDLYLLRNILHNWSDERCVALLRNCRGRMPEDATLAVVDMVAAEPTATASAQRMTGLMDLYMMCLFGAGRERGTGEFAELLDRAGFAVSRVSVLSMAVAVVEATPVRAAGPDLRT